MLETIRLYHKNMQNLENMDVFEILITLKLLKCPKDPFVRSALLYILILLILNFYGRQRGKWIYSQFPYSNFLVGGDRVQLRRNSSSVIQAHIHIHWPGGKVLSRNSIAFISRVGMGGSGKYLRAVVLMLCLNS